MNLLAACIGKNTSDDIASGSYNCALTPRQSFVGRSEHYTAMC